MAAGSAKAKQERETAGAGVGGGAPPTPPAGASGGGEPSGLARAPSAPAAALRVLVRWLLDALAAQIVERLREAEARERDPDWGMVSQKRLPAWIHPEVYVDACRAGRIEGARLWRRQWIASREAVERWWLAESRPPSEGGDDSDPESFDAMLKLNNLEPDHHRRDGR